MEESLKKFAKQFEWEPEISGTKPEGYSKVLVAGMGGSALPAMILKSVLPEKEIVVHKDYSLPEYIFEKPEEWLVIAVSYSGNTEETLDALEEAYSRGVKCVTITTGGKILEYSKTNNISFVEIPKENTQPRIALGYLLLALAKVAAPVFLPELKESGLQISASDLEKEANEIAENLYESVPIIYSSAQNEPVAYIWKIFMNETAKIPAFLNQFPELNHNEMAGYDFVAENAHLSKNLKFVFLKDSTDDEKIQKRMDVLQSIFEEKGFNVQNFYLEGENSVHKILRGALLGAWVALGLSKKYKTEPEKVEIIENFKKLL